MTADSRPLMDSLGKQGRVLHALLLREVITRFGRKNLGVLWLIGEPMLFTLGVATLWTMAGLRKTLPFPAVAFAVTGYSSVLMWRNAALRSGAAVQQNKPLLFHRNVRVLDVILMRILIEIAGATCSFVILSLVFIFVGWMPVPTDFLEVVFGWIMLAWFGTALSLLIGGGAAFSDMVERLWHPAAYLLFPISGAAFMVDWLPTKLQRIVLVLPMVHGVEILRDGYFGNAVRTHYNIPYMASICLVLTLAGLRVVYRAGRSVEF